MPSTALQPRARRSRPPAPPTGARPEWAIGVALGWYGVAAAGYLGIALALPPVDCTRVDCARSPRYLMLTLGAGVGAALLLCALLISVAVILVRSAGCRSAWRLGTSAAWSGLAGSLTFPAVAVLLYVGG